MLAPRPPAQAPGPEEQPVTQRSRQAPGSLPVKVPPPVPVSVPASVRVPHRPTQRVRPCRWLPVRPNRAADEVGWPCSCPLQLAQLRAQCVWRRVALPWVWSERHSRRRWRAAAPSVARAPRALPQRDRRLRWHWRSQARLRRWRDGGHGPHRPMELPEKTRWLQATLRRCVAGRCRPRCSMGLRCGLNSKMPKTQPNRRPAMPPRAACRPKARTGASISLRSPLAP